MSKEGETVNLIVGYETTKKLNQNILDEEKLISGGQIVFVNSPNKPSYLRFYYSR